MQKSEVAHYVTLHLSTPFTRYILSILQVARDTGSLQEQPKVTEVSASVVKSQHLTGRSLCSYNAAFVLSLQFLFATHSSDKDLIKDS